MAHAALRAHRAPARDDRGAVAAIASLLILVLVAAAALVVDIGMQRVARADMQSLADIVALDIARELDGRQASAIEPLLPGLITGARDRNSDVIDWEATKPTVTAQLGVLDADGAFSEVGGSAVPTAVRVTASTSVAFAFAGVTGLDDGDASRTAVAEASNAVCFRLGSFLAALRSGDASVLSALNSVLGLNLDLVSYKALAAADVRLADLVATPQIGSPTALLQGSLSYADLVRAVIDVLSRESTDNTVAITALKKVLAVSATLGSVALGNVMHIAPGDTAALEIDVNVLDLLGSARLSSGQHFLEVNNIQAGVPGVGYQFTGSIALISAAELACGRPNSAQAVARNSQIQGNLGVTFVNLPSLSIPNFATLQTPKGTGSVVVDIGNGQGQLVAPPEVHCGKGTAADPDTFTVDVTTSLASYRVNAALTVGGDVKVTDLVGIGLLGVLTNLLGVVLPTKVSIEVDVNLSVGTTSPGATSHADLSLPPNDVTPISTGSSPYLDVNQVVPTVSSVKINGKSVALGSVTSLTNLVVGELVSAGNGFLNKTLTPLVDNINRTLIGPVATMVGVRFAGADVYAVDVVCGLPRLRG